jgi:hypothetical protein
MHDDPNRRSAKRHDEKQFLPACSSHEARGPPRR